MTPRKFTSTKGTDAKATSHVQNRVSQKAVARETVQQLIAFAYTILVYPIESEGRLFNEECVKSPISSSCVVRPQLIISSNEGRHRLTRILDSIANICISQSKGEVVAVALQISNMDIRLIVASNASLPGSTITYLEEIWKILKQLSKDYQDHHRVHSKGPRRETSAMTRKCVIRVYGKGSAFWPPEVTATRFKTLFKHHICQ